MVISLFLTEEPRSGIEPGPTILKFIRFMFNVLACERPNFSRGTVACTTALHKVARGPSVFIIEFCDVLAYERPLKALFLSGPP